MGKRAADVVVGMLSDVGSSTRAAAPAVADTIARPLESAASPATSTSPPTLTPQPRIPPVTREPAPASVSAASSPVAEEPVIPRTLRLRTGTAGQLRAAWLLAKREDVLLTAQDFASDLVEEALRQRRQRAATSTA